MNILPYTRFKEELELLGYSPRSIYTYIRLVHKLAEHYLRAPDELSDEEVHQYLLYLLRKRKYARPTMIGVVCALRSYYRLILRRSTDAIQHMLPLMKSAATLPQFYERHEIERLLTVEGLRMKQRTMLTTAYAAGLRVSEVCHLKNSDILGESMLIRVHQSKGRKDRYTVLSPKLLNMLRQYWRMYRPPSWLFPNPVNPNKPITSRSLQRTFKCAVQLTGLPNRGGVHSLRHSFAMHMYESGVDLPTLQSLLGHKWLASTLVYMHVSQRRLREARSPIDLLDMGAQSVQLGTETGQQEADEPTFETSLVDERAQSQESED